MNPDCPTATMNPAHRTDNTIAHHLGKRTFGVPAAQLVPGDRVVLDVEGTPYTIQSKSAIGDDTFTFTFTTAIQVPDGQRSVKVSAYDTLLVPVVVTESFVVQRLTMDDEAMLGDGEGRAWFRASRREGGGVGFEMEFPGVVSSKLADLLRDSENVEFGWFLFLLVRSHPPPPPQYKDEVIVWLTLWPLCSNRKRRHRMRLRQKEHAPHISRAATRRRRGIRATNHDHHNDAEPRRRHLRQEEPTRHDANLRREQQRSAGVGGRLHCAGARDVAPLVAAVRHDGCRVD